MILVTNGLKFCVFPDIFDFLIMMIENNPFIFLNRLEFLTAKSADMFTCLQIMHIISGAEVDDVAGFYAKKLFMHSLIRIQRNILFQLERHHLRIENKILSTIINVEFCAHDRKYFCADYVLGMK